MKLSPAALILLIIAIIAVIAGLGYLGFRIYKKHHKKSGTYKSIAGTTIEPNQRTEDEYSHEYDTLLSFSDETRIVENGKITAKKLEKPATNVVYLVTGHDFLYEGKNRIPFLILQKYDTTRPAEITSQARLHVAYEVEAEIEFGTLTVTI